MQGMVSWILVAAFLGLLQPAVTAQTAGKATTVKTGAAKSAASNTADAEGHQWWQHAVFYEIYPRSFADSNND